MRQQMHEIIAISNTVDQPHFFVIMICNLAWPEVTKELLKIQMAQNHLELCSHAFHIKLREMTRCVQAVWTFGKVSAPDQVLEF